MNLIDCIIALDIIYIGCFAYGLYALISYKHRKNRKLEDNQKSKQQ